MSMTKTREKLIELLKSGGVRDFPFNAALADHLIANGVTVNGKKYEAIEKFIRSKVLDGKDYPTSALYWRDFEQELEKVYNGVTVQEWIPVNERLPEVCDSYLVVVKYKYDHEKEYDYDVDVATYYPYDHPDAYIDNRWDTYNDWDEGQQYIHITHWMPLPQPPKGE